MYGGYICVCYGCNSYTLCHAKAEVENKIIPVQGEEIHGVSGSAPGTGMVHIIDPLYRMILLRNRDKDICERCLSLVRKHG